MEKKSSIIGIGLTISNTPVDLREKMAIPEAEWPRAIAELCAYPHIEEAAVLSTCNRMELYVVALSWNRGVSEVSTYPTSTWHTALADSVSFPAALSPEPISQLEYKQLCT